MLRWFPSIFLVSNLSGNISILPEQYAGKSINLVIMDIDSEALWSMGRVKSQYLS